MEVKNNALFSSQRDDWETPKDLFYRLDKIYHFETDLCANENNAKCKKYYSVEQDGLKQEWKGSCWCNPPYGRGVGKWVEKAANSNALVVMLLPARTDTKWFHDYCIKKGTVEFLKGRVKFVGAKNNAPFPCMIVVFGGKVNGV